MAALPTKPAPPVTSTADEACIVAARRRPRRLLVVSPRGVTPCTSTDSDITERLGVILVLLLLFDSTRRCKTHVKLHLMLVSPLYALKAAGRRHDAAAQQKRSALCCSARLRVESASHCGASLPSARFQLAPTDAAAPGSCIAWALVFDVCPAAERVKAALEALLAAHPLFAARALLGASRWEVASVQGTGVPLEVCVLDADVDRLLSSGLGFRAVPFSAKAARALPFLVLPSTAAMDSGEAPLLALRLTRLLCGGGVLSATFSHKLTDGQRCVTLLGELARAVRGEVLPVAVDEERGRLWPDAFRALPSIAAALAVRRVPAAPAEPDTLACAPPPPSQPPTGWALVPVHINAQALDALLADIRERSSMRLSAHDAAAGLIWVLRCALAGIPLPGEPCSGRFIVALDLAANGLPPDALRLGWTGNCAAALNVEPPLPSATAGSGEMHAVAAAATALRRAISTFRSDPCNAIDHVLASASMRKAAWRATSASPLVGFATSCLRVPLESLDCGTGSPVAVHYSTLPLRSDAGLLFSSLAPGPRGDGLLILLAASERDAEAVGSVLRRVVPEARVLL